MGILIGMNLQPKDQTNQGYFKRYYQEHRERRLAQVKDRTAKMTPEQKAARSEYMKAYRLRNMGKWKRTAEQQANVNARRRELYAQDEWRRIGACEQAKEWHQANPEKRKAQRLKEYQLTVEEFNALILKQQGRCAICGCTDTGNPKYFPFVDHCHKTGRVRGLLCINCNHVLGKMMDDPERLRRAAAYLESNGSSGAD